MVAQKAQPAAARETRSVVPARHVPSTMSRRSARSADLGGRKRGKRTDISFAVGPPDGYAQKTHRGVKFPLAWGGRGSYVHPPRSNARASGPQWLRNDVKRSGNRLVAGSFDRFVNYARRLIQAGV